MFYCSWWFSSQQNNGYKALLLLSFTLNQTVDEFAEYVSGTLENSSVLINLIILPLQHGFYLNI